MTPLLFGVNVGRVTGLYAKYDAISLAYTRTYHNLDVPVKTAIQERLSDEGLATCTRKNTVLSLMQMIANQHVHRVVMVDEDGRLDGIVSLSDILSFLISDS